MVIGHALEKPVRQVFGVELDLHPPRAVQASGRGTLYSYTAIHRAPVPGFKTPAVIAIVELEEGVAMLSNLVRCAPEELRIGMP